MSKGRLFGLNKLQNHTDEGKGKEKKRERGVEEKKAMVALLGLISSVAYFYEQQLKFANTIEAIHERSHVSVKVEPRLTSRLSSAIFILPLFYLRD